MVPEMEYKNGKKTQPSLSFAGNVAENWREWKQHFKLYLMASGIDAKDQKIQSVTLLHMAGEEALEIYNMFTWFGTLSDCLIRHRIVKGIISDSTRCRLLQKADLTLEKAID